MITKHLLRADRQRQIPPSFSWVDHRLIRHRHLERRDHSAWALYLFLVTVADAQGLSYYSGKGKGVKPEAGTEATGAVRIMNRGLQVFHEHASRCVAWN